MRALRLAPVLLLAVAACQVDTDSLKPKTDEECFRQDPFTKACGPKCVRIDDPATGCGEPGCRPCPTAGAHTVAYCGGTASFCEVACEYGFGDCDNDVSWPGSNGCERGVLGNDSFNCGGCANRCNSGVCADGVCTGEVYSTAADPKGIANVQSIIYHVDAGLDAGSLWNSDTELKVVGGLPEATWIATVPGFDEVVVAATFPDGSTTTPYGYSIGLVDIANLSTSPVAIAMSLREAWLPGERVANLAGTEHAVYFTSTLGNTGVYALDDAGLTGSVASTTEIAGLVGHRTGLYYGTRLNGGEIHRIVETPLGTGAGNLYTDVVLARGAGTATRLAIFESAYYYTPTPLLFWTSADDGSVRSMPIDGSGPIVTHVPPLPESADYVDITADPFGVYFTNWWYQTVQMWRPWDDRVATIGSGYAPHWIAVRYPNVYWTDSWASPRGVYHVGIPH